MESERNEKFIKQFELNRKKAEERSDLYSEIGTGLNIIFKEFVKYGKIVEETTKKNLQGYFDRIQIKILELKDPAEICRLLIKEKGTYQAKIIEAKINKEGYLGKDYQAAIEQIIDPLLKHYESELEFEKKLPPSKTIINKLNSENQKTTENKNLAHINKTNLVPAVENGITKSEGMPPSNYEQISCDGSEQEILDFFMLLTTTKNKLNDECYMKAEDVKEFVKKNFSAFKTSSAKKYFDINLLPRQKNILIYFIYLFTVKYNRKLGVPKLKYAMLLINNFELFKGDNPETLTSNMSESKKPKSALDIIQIPKKN